MYEKVDSNLDFVPREEDVLSFWRENDIFKKSMQQREGCPVFTFYDGPPTANGKPHVGHVFDACHQGLDSAVPDDARPLRAAESRLGHARAAGGTRSGKAPRPRQQARDRAVRRGSRSSKRAKASVWKYKTEWERHERSASAFGPTWSIRTSPTKTTTSNRSGGPESKSGRRDCSTRATRSCRIARAAARRCRATKWRKAIATSTERIGFVRMQGRGRGPDTYFARLDDDAVDAAVERRVVRATPTSSTCCAKSTDVPTAPKARRAMYIGRRVVTRMCWAKMPAILEDDTYGKDLLEQIVYEPVFPICERRCGG
jgi:hypothetical protein